VLIWNLLFIVQDVMLFGGSRTRSPAVSPAASSPKARSGRALAPLAAKALVSAVVLLPVLESFGWFDHWPAWGLYSSRGDYATMFVHRLALARLPEHLRQYASIKERGDWVELRIDRWALDALAAPIYPQARFQIGVAEGIARQWRLGPHVRVVRFGPASRLTGRRDQEVNAGQDAITLAASRFLLNAHPRAPSVLLLTSSNDRQPDN
jgi:hypothetical protein